MTKVKQNHDIYDAKHRRIMHSEKGCQMLARIFTQQHQDAAAAAAAASARRATCIHGNQRAAKMCAVVTLIILKRTARTLPLHVWMKV